jgi:hypothetical protein
MKKNFLYGISVLAIAAVAAWNVNFNSQKNNGLSDIQLANVEALAQEGGNANNCPGGYCSWSNYVGENCTACCPTGKNPSCKSSGCGCS